MKKVISILLSVMLVFVLIVGCAKDSPKTETTKPDASETTNDVEKPQESDIVIGFSTGASGSNFRTIGIGEFKAVAESYKAEGRIKDFKIVNNVNDWDASEQANIIRDFVNDPEINVIVLNPNSATDLNGVLEEAVKAGKVVVVVDTEVDVEGVVSVSINHYDWSLDAANYVAKTLGSGTAIQIYGGDGHPANNERIRATYDVLKDYPGINLVADTSGGWDEQVAKDVATQILGSGTQVDAIFTQDAMASGVLSACIDLNKIPKVMFGECGTTFVKQAKDVLDKGIDFKFFTQPNPAGIMASGLRIAVALAEGKEMKDGVLGGLYGSTYYYAVNAHFTEADIAELQEIFKDKSDDYLLSEYLSEEEAAELFK